MSQPSGAVPARQSGQAPSLGPANQCVPYNTGLPFSLTYCRLNLIRPPTMTVVARPRSSQPANGVLVLFE